MLGVHSLQRIVTIYRDENIGQIHFVARTSSSAIKFCTWHPPTASADDYIQFSISSSLELFIGARASVYEQDR